MPANINKSHNQENPHIIPIKNKTQSPLAHLYYQTKTNPLLDSPMQLRQKIPRRIPIHLDAQISPLIPPSTTIPSTSKNPIPISNFTPKYPLISCPQYSRALSYTSCTTRSITSITQKLIRTTNIVSHKSQSSLSLT